MKVMVVSVSLDRHRPKFWSTHDVVELLNVADGPSRPTKAAAARRALSLLEVAGTDEVTVRESHGALL